MRTFNLCKKVNWIWAETMNEKFWSSKYDGHLGLNVPYIKNISCIYSGTTFYLLNSSLFPNNSSFVTPTSWNDLLMLLNNNWSKLTLNYHRLHLMPLVFTKEIGNDTLFLISDWFFVRLYDMGEFWAENSLA